MADDEKQVDLFGFAVDRPIHTRATVTNLSDRFRPESAVFQRPAWHGGVAPAPLPFAPRQCRPATHLTVRHGIGLTITVRFDPPRR